MFWKDFLLEKPDFSIAGKHFLITDGKNIYIAWTDHSGGYIFFKSNGSCRDKEIKSDDPEGNVIITHWVYVNDIPFP
jgi:hypothetical protein